jgi:hypothetical protein
MLPSSTRGADASGSDFGIKVVRADEPPSAADGDGGQVFFLSRFKRHLFRMPVFQFLALFYFATPSFEQVGEALNVFGIIGALLLSLVMSLPGSLTYEDYQAANQRMSNTTVGVDYGKYKEMWYANSLSFATPAVSDSFFYDINLSISALSTSVLLVVVVYFHLVFGRTAEHAPHVTKREREKMWWRWTKWVILATVLLLVAGIVMFYLAFWKFVLIKLPDQGLEPEPLLPVEKYAKYYIGVYGFTFRIQMILLGCVLAFMCIMGVAQWSMMELDDLPPPQPKPLPPPGTDAQLAALLAALYKKAKTGDEDEDIEADELLLLLRLLRRVGFAGAPKCATPTAAAPAPQQPPARLALAQRPRPPLADALEPRPLAEANFVRRQARAASPEREQSCW